MNLSRTLLVLLLAALSACDGVSDPLDGARIELAPDELEILVGDTLWLLATAYDADGRRISNPDLEWRRPPTNVVETMYHWFIHDHEVPEDRAGARLRGIALGAGWVVAEGYGAADSVFVTVRGHEVALRSVEAGDRVVCGLNDEGAAYCWGSPEYPLGTGPSYPGETFVPAPVGGDLRFTSLTVGREHVCGLTPAGEAYCWGLNLNGQLGSEDPDLRSSHTPSRVAGEHTFSELSSGGWHTCGLSPGGALYCWGLDSYGQLGIGEAPSDGCAPYGRPCSRTPVRVAPELTFSHVSAERSVTCALTTSGTPYCWGSNPEQLMGHESADLCSLDFLPSPCSHTPQPVEGAPDLVSLATGSQHACGLTPDGQAFCWGHNRKGELGTGTIENSRTPVPVAGGHRFQQLEKYCGLTLEGQAYCWGPNNWWGNGTEEHEICPGGVRCNLTPVAVSGGLTFRSISRAEHNACGLTDDGVYCWGRNRRGLLGTGYWEPDRSALPLRVYDGG